MESAAARQGWRILIVDDSPIDRQVAAKLLIRRLPVIVEHAEHGAAALQKMGRSHFDLVLTDLNMPHMDGLELVDAIRRLYPLVPTILMTAHGSEDTALQALRRGAVSYVPKRRLSSDLADTVQDVLSVCHRDTHEPRLLECWAQTEFEFRLGTDVSLVPILISHLQRYLRRVGHCDEVELIRVGVALNEALQNALFHGNLELNSELRNRNGDEYFREAQIRRSQDPYRQRQVRLSARESPDEARYIIGDEGPGFDVSRALAEDPTDPDNLTRLSGRGLFLIRNFMSEVQFNAAGNEITMIHRRSITSGPSHSGHGNHQRTS
ncbi:MAG: response regulator [Planctomycetes bacterium]|nr:response regulator [Planctomycetota bacterium]